MWELVLVTFSPVQENFANDSILTFNYRIVMRHNLLSVFLLLVLKQYNLLSDEQETRKGLYRKEKFKRKIVLENDYPLQFPLPYESSPYNTVDVVTPALTCSR